MAFAAVVIAGCRGHEAASNVMSEAGAPAGDGGTEPDTDPPLPPNTPGVEVRFGRVRGVAPFLAFADARATKHAGVARPFHDLAYVWDFGDPGAGTWQFSGQSKNTDVGPLAGHVYEKPGKYVLELTVRFPDGTNGKHRTRITVDDPEVVFASERTVCLSTAGAFDGCPANARRITSDAIREHVVAAQRVLLRRGERFPGFSVMTNNGPGIIAPFGPGTARPTIVGSLDVDRRNSISDWRVVDLAFVVGKDPLLPSLGLAGREMRDLLFLRLEANNIPAGWFALANGHWGTGGTPIPERIGAVDNTAMTSGGLPCGRQLFIAGNRLDGVPPTGEHVLRFFHIDQSVISHNFARDANPQKHVFKIHAMPFRADLPTTDLVIRDNRFSSTRSGQAAALYLSPGSGDPGDGERVANSIIDANIFLDGTNVFASGQGLTIRNNLFVATNYPPVEVGNRPSFPLPPDGIQVEHNTFVTKTGIPLLAVDAGSKNIVARNNLAATNSTFPPLPGTTYGGNVMSPDPVYVSGTGKRFEDFAPAASSPALNAGVPTGVMLDALRAVRGSPTDVGAVER